MQIRHAKQQDLEAIVSIYNETIDSRMATADLFPVSVADKQAWFEAHDNNHYPLWVMIENDAVVAWLSAHAYHTRPAYAGSAEVSVYVAKQHRGKGIAKQLITHLFKTLPSLPLHSLLAFIFAHNEISLTLFKTFEFEQWGYLPGVTILDDKPCDVVILGRKV